MVVMELQCSVRASPSAMEEEEVLEREKEATKGVDQKALLPPLYIGGPRGGVVRSLGDPISYGRRPRGGFPPPQGT